MSVLRSARLLRVMSFSLALGGFSAEVGALSPPSPSQIKDFITALFSAAPNACPSAYTQNSNVPTIDYTGLTKLRSSQLVARVNLTDIAQNQALKAGPYLNLPLPNGQKLGGFAPPTQGADIYRIHYQSTDIQGHDTRLSGLVVIPSESIEGGLIVYDHATQLSQSGGAPSFPSGEACIMITALGGKNRMLAMPDYLGFGISSDAHPYPLGIQNAPSGVDIVTASRELAREIYPEKPVGSALFVTGYSEGGGNALWLGRLMEQSAQPGMKPTLMAPMSGNYDMTGAMAKSLIVNQPLNPITLLAKPLLVTFAAQGAWDVTGMDPNALVQPSLVNYDIANSLPIPYSGSAEMGVYMSGLALTAYQLGYTKTGINPAVLMQPSLVSDIQTKNLANPVINLWAENDNIDWRPVTPIYATGILQDQLVPFAASSYPVPAGFTGGKPFFSQGNSQNLIQKMRAKGIGSNAVAWCAIDAQKVVNNKGKPVMINHLNGLIPVSILSARAIENSSLAGLPMLSEP